MKNIRSDLKIIVVGNANTGKTSYVNKWTKNEFRENYKATIVSEFGYKIYQYKGNVYRIQMWDLAGQDKNTTMTKIFCKDSHGVIILSDTENNESLESTVQWKKIIDDSVLFFDNTPLPMMLCQNKIDLVDPLDRKEKELIEFGKKNGFICNFQTSVKENIKVNESMNEFLGLVIDKTEGLKNQNIGYDNRDSIVLNNNGYKILNGKNDGNNKNNYRTPDKKCCS